MLAEGLLLLFEDLSPLALDRISRSQFLGLTMKDPSVVAISSAWKAHIEFETSEFEAMVKSLEIAISHSGDDDHDAHARLSMVISDSFLLCGDNRSAQKWFLRSRDHALSDGDQASIEALQYNRAAFRLARLRAARCIWGIESDQLSFLRVEIASAKNLQLLTRVAALTNFIHLCEARLLILEERYDQAIEALDNIRSARPFADYNFDQSFVDLEIAFCLECLGRRKEARLKFDLIKQDSFERLDADERLVAAWMRYQLCASDEIFGDIVEAKAKLDILSGEYQNMTLDLLEMLKQFRFDGS